jgi:hypothetical protein
MSMSPDWWALVTLHAPEGNPCSQSAIPATAFEAKVQLLHSYSPTPLQYRPHTTTVIDTYLTVEKTQWSATRRTSLGDCFLVLCLDRQACGTTVPAHASSNGILSLPRHTITTGNWVHHHPGLKRYIPQPQPQPPLQTAFNKSRRSRDASCTNQCTCLHNLSPAGTPRPAQQQQPQQQPQQLQLSSRSGTQSSRLGKSRRRHAIHAPSILQESHSGGHAQ